MPVLPVVKLAPLIAALRIELKLLGPALLRPISPTTHTGLSELGLSPGIRGNLKWSLVTGMTRGGIVLN